MTILNRSRAALIVVLALALAGVPDLVAQQTQPAPQPQPANPTAEPGQPIEPAQDVTPPEQAPATEPQPEQQDQTTLPNAPSAEQQQQQQNQQVPAQPAQEPAGTAAAGKAETVGGAASKPAGTAIAPAKQHQVRSWLIKLGVIAAAGAALGVVYGLSKSSPSKPPGATTTAAPAPAP